MKHGDIVSVGPHKILCGDCTDVNQTNMLFEPSHCEAASTVIFSPPYLNRRSYGNKSGAEGTDLFCGALKAMFYTRDVQVFAVVGNLHTNGEQDMYFEDWLHEARAQGWKRFSTYVWDKQHGYPGAWAGRLAPCHDWIFHLNKESRLPKKWRGCKWGQGRHRQQFKYKAGNFLTGCAREKMNIVSDWKIDDSIVRINPGGRCGKIGHPAVFPWLLPHRILLSYGAPGGVVYDPMLGSGSTIIAAHEAGLVGYGCEINPEYCELAVERIRKHMEKKKCG